MRIEGRGLFAGYGRKEVVRGVDLCLGPGECVGLIGPNGAGKSTLLRMLSRAMPLTAGKLKIGGRPSQSLTAREVAREIAFVPQTEPAVFDFAVRDVVLMGRNPHVLGLSGERREDYAEAARAMSATDTLQLAERPVTELSGGEHRRVLIARALAQKAPTLLLDEPTAHLDLTHQREILSLVRGQVDRDGVSCLAALHDLNLAGAFCDRLILLFDGRILAEGPVSEILKVDTLTRAFGLGIQVARTSTGSVVLPAPPVNESPNGESRRIHVVCGGGSGAETLSMLQRRRYSITAGVLNRMDSDQFACESLEVEHVSESPFSPLGREALDACAKLMRGADLIVVTDVPFGIGNLGNLQLAADAQEAGKPVCLFGAIPIAERDFTGGEATRLWNLLVERGAHGTTNVHELDAMLRRELSVR